ncbi:MAG: TIGR00159 family protein [Planctomycetota bacterium]|nr:MAG: TIGR00159 family protein [Planctomycetota bacterium]
MFEWKFIIEVFILFFIFYGIIRFIQGSRGENILKGISFIFLVAYVVLFFLAKSLHLEEVLYLLSNLLRFFLFGMIVVFQPELRRGFLKLGQTRFFKATFSGREVDFFEEIITAALRLSRQKVGALIAIAGEVGLKKEIEGGVLIGAQVSHQLIETIFYPGTPLHDGAVIIQEDILVAASCLFPLTESQEIARELGTRHRAAVGVTEESDAIVIIVSEETGGISIAYQGNLYRNLDKDEFRQKLKECYMSR